MSDLNRAKEIIDGLVRAQKSNDNKLSNVEKQLDDLKTAQRLVSESINNSHTVEYTGNEGEFRNFIREDGSLQFTTEVKHLTNPQGGRVSLEENGLLDSDFTVNDWHAELKSIARDRKLARLIMPEPYTPKLDAKLYRHLNKAPKSILPSITKAFNDQTGTGAEFIPDQFVSDLYMEFQLPRRLRSLLPRVQADRNVILLPRMDRGGRPYIKGEITVDNPLAQYTTSTAATGQKSVSIKGLAVSYVIDDAFAEDSAIAALPTLSSQIAMDIEDGFEDCMINGDTSASHQDALANWNIRSRWGASGLGSAADHRRAFNGMRRAAFVQNSSSAAADPTALASTDILKGLTTMGEMGAGNVVMVVSPEFMLKHLMDLPEVQTLDKFGPAASVLSGQIGSVYGVPIVLSRFLSADLNASGKFDNSVTDNTGFLMFNTSSWYLYERRGIVVENDKDISAGAIRLVSTYRAVMDSPDQTSVNNVFFGYNYDAVQGDLK